MSTGADVESPENSRPDWEVRSDPEEQVAVDGGSGEATLELTPEEETGVTLMAARTASDPTSDPQTGAELGMSEDAVLDELNDHLSKADK